jgi:hypothetical protein
MTGMRQKPNLAKAMVPGPKARTIGVEFDGGRAARDALHLGDLLPISPSP